MALKLTVKTFVATFFHLIGAFNILNFQKQWDNAFILMYHRILRSPHEEPVFVQPGMYVSLDTFRRQVEFLKERFEVLPLAELVKRVETGRSVRGCCAITFDDGWLDNFTNAFPVLLEFQLPATIFLATGFTGTNQLFWPEELTYYLRQPDVRAAIGKSQIWNHFLDKVPCDSEEAFLDNAVIATKNCLPHEREDFLEFLRSSSDTLPTSRMLMDWAEAGEMQASGLISFGAHTANHIILDQVSQQCAEEEILQSRLEIENRLGVSPEFFAYPNGNFTRDLQAILKRHGFRGAVATRKGWIGNKPDLYDIPRIGMHEDVSCTIPLFLARLLLKGF